VPTSRAERAPAAAALLALLAVLLAPSPTARAQTPAISPAPAPATGPAPAPAPATSPAPAPATGPAPGNSADPAQPAAGPQPGAAPVPAPVLAPDPPGLTAAGAVLVDPLSGLVLHADDAESPRLIASTTKVMTALLALEAGTIEQQVSVSANAVAVGAAPGAANLELRAGQSIAMRSLLTGLIMRSGNDAAVAVAEHVAGDEPTFVARMNARAQELGLTATSFVDASGLGEEPGNRSSPLDLARLADVALRDPEFASWAGAAQRTVEGLEPLTNRNLLLGAYEGATGVKTGYTSGAGLCLVASATRGDRTLYAVVLDSEDSFADAAALLDHGFDDYRRVVPAGPAVPVVTYRWGGAQAPVVAAEPLDVTVPLGTPVTWRASLDPVEPRPAAAGTGVGSAELVVGGAVVDTVELRLAADAPPPDPARSPAAQAGAAVQEALRGFARLESLDRGA